MKWLLFVSLTFLLSTSVQAQRKKVTVEYKKRQKIDLGALMIDGEIVSPGDFSIDNEKEKASKLLYRRRNYNDRLRINIEYVF